MSVAETPEYETFAPEEPVASAVFPSAASRPIVVSLTDGKLQRALLTDGRGGARNRGVPTDMPPEERSQGSTS